MPLYHTLLVISTQSTLHSNGSKCISEIISYKTVAHKKEGTSFCICVQVWDHLFCKCSWQSMCTELTHHASGFLTHFITLTSTEVWLTLTDEYGRHLLYRGGHAFVTRSFFCTDQHVGSVKLLSLQTLWCNAKDIQVFYSAIFLFKSTQQPGLGHQKVRKSTGKLTDF